MNLKTVLCHYCGCEVFKGSRQNSRKRPLLTRDHIIPKSRTKGSSNYETVPACVACNSEKGGLTIDEYRVVLAFRYGYISGVDYTFPGEELAPEQYDSTIALNSNLWDNDLSKTLSGPDGPIAFEQGRSGEQSVLQNFGSQHAEDQERFASHYQNA